MNLTYLQDISLAVDMTLRRRRNRQPEQSRIMEHQPQLPLFRC